MNGLSKSLPAFEARVPAATSDQSQLGKARSTPHVRLPVLSRSSPPLQLSDYRYDAFFAEGIRFGGSWTTWCPLSTCRAFAASAIRFKSSSLESAIASRIDRSSSRIELGATMAATP